MREGGWREGEGGWGGRVWEGEGVMLGEGEAGGGRVSESEGGREDEGG